MLTECVSTKRKEKREDLGVKESGSNVITGFNMPFFFFFFAIFDAYLQLANLYVWVLHFNVLNIVAQFLILFF